MAASLVGSVALCAGQDVERREFDLRAVPLGQVVTLYFSEVSKRAHVICPDVLADSRAVSIRAQGRTLDAAMLVGLLGANGYEVRSVDGVDIVCKKAELRPEADAEPLVYRPRYRDAAYLVDLVSPLVKGTFANKRVSAGALAVGKPDDKGSSASASTTTLRPGGGDDFILFVGAERERAKLQGLLGQLDTPAGEVLVKGYLYEVGSNEAEGSALSMILRALSGRVEVSVGSAGSQGSALKVRTPSLDFVASILNSDARFKIVTSPFTRVRSGGSARLQVGQDVPVLGAIVSNANGQTQQSVDYKQSGVIIEVAPNVRGSVTDLDLVQTVSDFVSTETGLSNTPTLNKREIRTALSVEDGELLVIGGLNGSKVENGRAQLPWFGFNLSKARASRTTELVLVLEVKRL
ncbi:type II secretory pathway component GspD/PulD (secretin) [Inhella inkyongensis]|uniref:Type II secretory pathway component GspD/PulD (Secretin) n=1 Tax=Inhella inkyongensis TaxID=392593 RepID=A0A840S2K0_9BURK|nr:type II secretory pathway protein [Inhella inkyongensis]MBB5202820.1 type II secretory pathway component GspD/PulD (secretin) [Inhella inkyongensis]